MSQDITAVVVAATVTPKPKFCLSQFLDAIINEDVFLELPALSQSSYKVTSKQDFAATFEENKLQVLSQMSQMLEQSICKLALSHRPIIVNYKH